MKQVFLSLLLTLTLPAFTSAQQQDSSLQPIIGSGQGSADDTILQLNQSARADTTPFKKDIPDSSAMTSYYMALDHILGGQAFIKSTVQMEELPQQIKHRSSKEYLFYLLAGLLLVLALVRLFFIKYFTTLFRVFFSTSLRQTQLTDQLMQAKLPSLVFNLFFIVSTGLFTWLVLNYYGLNTHQNRWLILAAFVLAFGLVYFFKFTIIKVAGWVTGQPALSNGYIFIIFMINKIFGILVVPFLVIIAFSEDIIRQAAITLALLMAASFFLLRFYKAYGLLKGKLKLGPVHFILLIFALEVVPLLLLYKALWILLHKNM